MINPIPIEEEFYDSAARQPVMLDELVNLIRYRDLLGQLIVNNIKTRYRRSVLGVLWTLLNPLMTMTVMTVAFSSLFNSAVPNYPVYIMAGLLFWTFLSQSISAAMSSMVWGSNLLKRIYVPRTIFATAAIGNTLVNLGLGLVPLVIIMLVLGHPFSPAILFLPVAVALTAMFVLGMSFLLSTLAVFFTDIVDIFQVFLTAWFYLTPIIYPPQILPEGYRAYLFLNPAYNLLSLFREPIYLGQLPSWQTMLAATLSSVITLLVGWWFFTNKSDEFAYRL
jgi:ABC-type polysaccharide/polyol phosphate export permease